MQPKHFRNCPVLNKCREDDEADDSDHEDDNEDNCALHMKILDFK